MTVLAQALVDVLDQSRLEWSVLFVDDSDDATVDVLTDLAAGCQRVSVLHRPVGSREGGLSGAVLAGLAASESRFVVVMDGDLQHPPAVVPSLVSPLASGAADIVVASRYCEGGSPGGLAGPYRRVVSSGARGLVRMVFPRTTRVSDPLGGFFAFDRSVVADVGLRPSGFKILLEILARGRWSRVAEVPFEFAARYHGTSKASLREGFRFLRHVGRLARSAAPAAPAPVPAAH